MQLAVQNQLYQSTDPSQGVPGASTNQQSNGPGFFSKIKKIFLILFFITIILVLSLGAYKYKGNFLGNNAVKQETLSVGYQRFLDISSKNKSFISGASIQAIFSGRLKSVEAGTSWVLEKDGKTLTLNHTGVSNIRYFRRSLEQGKASVSVQPQEIKVGEEVTIVALIDLISANMRVVSIEAKEPLPAQLQTDVQVSTPGATQ